MSGSDDTFRRANPFPASPAVQLRVVSHERQAGASALDPPVSIETPAWKRLWGQVAEYLERPGEATTRGRALALIGDLGRGKSHLALQVITEVQARDEAVPVWVIDQPGADLTSFYRNQLTAMFDNQYTRQAFERVVETFHAHVTAAAVENGDGIGLDDRARPEFARQLRGDELDSMKVVRSFDIDEDVIYRHLRTELREVTGHRQFAAAFTLLLDRRFNSAAWAWLSGGPPDQYLIEHGITTPIDGVRGVLDALTVFGFLHGQVGKPYVLVVDALEQAVDGRAVASQEFLGAFESLVNTYVNRGGLLVLTTLPDPWSRLPGGLRERILQIWPPRMTREETEELVSAYVRRRPPSQEVAPAADEPLPFTRQALDELAEIGDGVPRQIIKICRQAWQSMADRPASAPGPRTIDAGVLQQAVRTLTEQRAPRDVYDEVERALAERQRAHESRPVEVLRAADPQLNQVRYWVRVDEGDVIGILVVPSVLLDGEVDDIEAVDRAARAAFDGGCRLLVLVNGTVSRRRFNALNQRIGTTPLLVGDIRFSTALRDDVELLAARLTAARQGGEVSAVWNRLAAMSAEQKAVLSTVQQMDATLRRGAAAAPGDDGDLLPAAVAARFSAAHDALETLAEPPRAIRDVFGLDASGRPLAGSRPRRFALGAEQLSALGLVSAVGQLVVAFRSGVADWRRAVARRADGVDPELRESLFVLCRSFEISMEVLPELGGAGAAGQPAGPEDAVRRAEARDLLNRLAEGVRGDLLADGAGVSE